jgi:hypothetical protein
MKILIEFKDLHDKVKKYANDNCEGNFSLAVRELIRKGLSK